MKWSRREGFSPARKRGAGLLHAFRLPVNGISFRPASRSGSSFLRNIRQFCGRKRLVTGSGFCYDPAYE